MTDLDQILPLWQELRAKGSAYVLATVVEVEGSGYRKPGARMMIAADGRRAGTLSGGCLEGEVARKAFWHTGNGPVLRRYSTKAEDGDVPFGMGCGGVVHVLLERPETADPLLERIAAHYAQRTPLAFATALELHGIVQRAFWPRTGEASGKAIGEGNPDRPLEELARCGYERQSSFSSTAPLIENESARVHIEWIPARTGLFVFGAGDDVIPLVKLARLLGWYTVIADGRSNLATQARFPEAHEVHLLAVDAPPAFDLRPTDAAVVMTHSLDQDTRALSLLLPADLAYLGVLGPQRRTAEILATVAESSGLPQSRAGAMVEAWMDRLHSPMGLDLGGDTPTEIAVSVVAEIQQNRRRGTGMPLRQLRGELRSVAQERQRVPA